jgi:ATP-dependent protease ClpP protease subunit
MENKPFRTTRHLANLKQGRNDWYRIKAQADGPAQLHIYDEIGYFGVTASDMIADLANVAGDLEVHLNTPGGEVFDGIAIFNALKQRDGTVRIVVDSLAASIGSVIAQAASPGNLIIAKNASMMIHDGFGMAIGNAKDMREMADLLDKTSDNIASIYADRTGQPAGLWRDAMLAETWYVGQEAVDAGLADYVQGAEPDGAASAQDWDLSVFARAPGQILAAAEPEPAPIPADDLAGRQNMAGGVGYLLNADKYNADDRKRMASSGHAMPDGSYPIADEEDLGNAIHAVGRGGSDHDAIRAHIIKRAEALGLSSRIPDNWNTDGSMKDQARTGFLILDDAMSANIRAALEEAQQ